MKRCRCERCRPDLHTVAVNTKRRLLEGIRARVERKFWALSVFTDGFHCSRCGCALEDGDCHLRDGFWFCPGDGPVRAQTHGEATSVESTSD